MKSNMKSNRCKLTIQIKKDRKYTKLLHDEFNLMFSTIIRAVNDLLEDKKTINVPDPGMYLISFPHDSSKYHPKCLQFLDYQSTLVT